MYGTKISNSVTIIVAIMPIKKHIYYQPNFSATTPDNIDEMIAPPGVTHDNTFMTIFAFSLGINNKAIGIIEGIIKP